MVLCTVCKKDFSKHSNLRKHVLKFHPGEIDVIAPNKLVKNSVVCNKCSKTFSKYWNLKQHVLKFHSNEQVEQLRSPKVYSYECKDCNRNFSNIKDFKYHEKKHFDEKKVDKRLHEVKCILCSYICVSKLTLYNHFNEEHDIQISSKILHFPNTHEFKEWKFTLEQKMQSLYVNDHGSYKSLNAVKTTYVCQRSGYYIAKGTAKRHLKTQGSKKINGLCPSEMHVKVLLETGEHEVTFIETHVGHDNILGHLNLTVSQRMEIAEKIASKVPLTTILDDIRDSVNNEKLERIHLLTKKDLHNITQTFNLNNDYMRHKNDVLSIEAWINEIRESETVVYYKPQNKSCERYTYLKEEDFILIIMHPGQLEMLMKFSDKCVCIDGTHGLNAYKFELTTLLVLDEMNEGFPCCFMFSNRSDEEIMVTFFNEIKEKLNRKIQPNVFMSDMAQYYYTAWVQVMLSANFRLFCTWHVDRAWRKNLNKLQSQEQKTEVYKKLRTLLQERDPEAFSTMLQNFVALMFASNETMEFGLYFKQYYMDNANSWAYCYRLGVGINTNMHIERMHQTIKYIYLHGKNVQRLDKTISVLMKFVKDKLFEKVITMNKGKISTKIKELRNRHTKSKYLNVSAVMQSETGWQVPSSTTNEIYHVEEKIINCDCKLICSFCEACLHLYSCTCLDNSIRWNMCKHIHLVCQYRKSFVGNNVIQTDEDIENVLVVDDTKTKFEEEHQRFAELLTNQKGIQEDLNARKEKLKKNLLHQIEKVASSEQIEAFERIVAPLEPVMRTLQEKVNQKMVLSTSSKRLPHNKPIVKQRRLFSTVKKAKVKKSNSKIKKPTAQEADIIAVQLLKIENVNE